MTFNIPAADHNPSDADIHFLDDQINRYNVQATGITDGRVMSFLSGTKAHGSSLASMDGLGVAPVKSAICGFEKGFVNVAMERP